jgi:hypothetical protein
MPSIETERPPIGSARRSDDLHDNDARLGAAVWTWLGWLRPNAKTNLDPTRPNRDDKTNLDPAPTRFNRDAKTNLDHTRLDRDAKTNLDPAPTRPNRDDKTNLNAATP